MQAHSGGWAPNGHACEIRLGQASSVTREKNDSINGVHVSRRKSDLRERESGFCKMMRYFKSESGYVLAIGLLFLPIFVLMALLVIDISRGNNAQSDLQAAADAVALAGAVELDAGSDAITRAEASMRNVWNSVSLLEPGGPNSAIELDYDRDYTVIFLEDIPASDDTVIDQAWVDANRTTDGRDAAFVYVRAEAVPFQSIFASAMATLTGQVRVMASAVATSWEAACDVPPLFMCNPFEDEPEGSDLEAAFAQGKLHGRLVQLHPPGNLTAAPGNFGFLQTNGSSSANAIREFFAGSYVPVCYDASTVETKPGAAVSIRTGINIRFDMYDAPFKNDADLYAPAYNVRKGYTHTGAICTKQELLDPPDPTQAMGFPPNGTMAPPGSGVSGAAIGSGNWDLVSYWNANHGTTYDPLDTDDQDALNALIGSSMPGAVSPGATMPSRYDVYRYEIENGLVGDVSPGGESGMALCSASKPGALAPTDPFFDANAKDRRVTFIAIIDCLANPFNGQATVPVNSFASIFLTNPMEKQGSGGDGTIDIEVIDITGNSGNGTLDAFVRREAWLVR